MQARNNNMQQRYLLKRFIKTENGNVYDTTKYVPHVECYFVEEYRGRKVLFAEHTFGDVVLIGNVIQEVDTIEELN